MNLTFDSAKDKSDQAKHGVSLAEALRLEWELALIEVDRRNEYGEVREITYAPIKDRLYFVAFTRRGGVLRIISLCKANQREFDHYVSKINPPN